MDIGRVDALIIACRRQKEFMAILQPNYKTDIS
jgi:hypothetical protein